MSQPKPKQIRGADVAREAGVSQSSVSLVLSGRPDTRIPEETRRRVLEAVERLGYRRNSAARSLVTGKSGRIGVVPSHPNSFTNRDYYYGALLAGIMGGVIDRNLNVLLHSSGYPDWKVLFEDVTNGSVDGVILIGRDAGDPLSLALLKAAFPVVFISCYPENLPCHAIDCDNEEGGYLAAKHLLESGYRRLRVLSKGSPTLFNRERQAGMKRAVSEANLPPETLTLLEVPDLNESNGREWTSSVILLLGDYSSVPTALLTGDEWYATRFAKFLSELGFSVPEDFAIVSFNSTEASALCCPPLTSVRQPLYKIGTLACKTLLGLIEGEKGVPQVQRLSVRLDVRASTRNVEEGKR